MSVSASLPFHDFAAGVQRCATCLRSPGETEVKPQRMNPECRTKPRSTVLFRRVEIPLPKFFPRKHTGIETEHL